MKKKNKHPSRLALPAGSHPARSSRPNIVFNLADDQGQADASVYEALRLQTPTAEKLAKSSNNKA
jgi:arylsulfatase A-like enzyme